MIGFAPFNRPVAKIFLGDVGSLPIGLLLFWLLLLLAGNGAGELRIKTGDGHRLIKHSRCL